MLGRLTDAPGPFLTVFIDGVATRVRHGDSVAAAMLASEHSACRTTVVSGTPRGPYCLMGVCFDCLVTVDGAANRQGCMVQVREGMRIESQRGKPEIDL
jgi:D-hydroxyproline dehydrogenase subunit gamma